MKAKPHKLSIVEEYIEFMKNCRIAYQDTLFQVGKTEQELEDVRTMCVHDAVMKTIKFLECKGVVE